jgi:hypothetical protein
MNEKKEFKDLTVTWSYILTCSHVWCSICKNNMRAYADKKLLDDSVDFGDMAQCECGNATFDGIHPGII